MKPMTAVELQAHQHRTFEQLPNGTLTDVSDMTEAEVYDYDHPDQPPMTQEQSVAFNATDMLRHWSYVQGEADLEAFEKKCQLEVFAMQELVQNFIITKKQ
jgi:hypothetical protein